MTVNYFYAMYVLSKCDSFIASGLSNGIDMVKGFNLDHFRHYYQFSVGMAITINSVLEWHELPKTT